MLKAHALQGSSLRYDQKSKKCGTNLTMNGEKAMAVNYEFKLELGRQMLIGNFMSK